MKRIAMVLPLFVMNIYALNLHDAVIGALAKSPIIKERIKNYNATVEDVTIAKSGYYPKLDYIGGIGYENTNSRTTGFVYKDYNVYENSIILKQNIFTGWGTKYSVATQRSRVLAAAYNYVEKVNDTAYRAIQHYISIVKNRELLSIAQENIDINKNILLKVRKLYKAGLTALSEREKINSSYALSKSNYIVQKNNLLDSIFQFKYYYGQSVNADDLKSPNENVFMPQSYEKGLQEALLNNPSILVQKYNVEVAKNDYKQKKSNYYPKIDLEARQSWNHNMGAVEGRDNSFRLMATLSYNFFNGYKDKATIQKGLSKIHRELNDVADLKNQTEEQFNLAWNAYKELADQLKFLKEYKKYAVNTLRLYSKEYDMGKRSLLDLLSAQNDLINAKSQIVKTRYDYIFAKYRILDAMGLTIDYITKKMPEIYGQVNLSSKKLYKKDIFPEKELKENKYFLQGKLKQINLDK